MGAVPKGGSNDRPAMPQIFQDKAAGKMLLSVASMTRRNFIIPELKSSLVAKERKALLAYFAPSRFTRRASVLMGEPSSEHKAKVQGLMLASKRAKAVAVREV